MCCASRSRYENGKAVSRSYHRGVYPPTAPSGGWEGVLLHRELVQDAAVKVIANIAESACNLEEHSKERHADIPWHMIRGFRNILVHDYLGDLEMEEVWTVFSRDLPVLVGRSKTAA